MNDLGDKSDALRAAVKFDITEVRKIAWETRDLAEASATVITSLHKHLFHVEKKCNAFNVENKRLICSRET